MISKHSGYSQLFLQLGPGFGPHGNSRAPALFERLYIYSENHSVSIAGFLYFGKPVGQVYIKIYQTTSAYILKIKHIYIGSLGKYLTKPFSAEVSGHSPPQSRSYADFFRRLRLHISRHCLQIISQAGQDGEILMFDVSNRQQTSKAIESWENAHPEEYIEVLVNNAGIRRDNLLIFMPENDWHRVLSISLDGFYNVTQPLLQSMLARKFGRVINMASVSGVKGMPGQTNYSAAKGAIIAATKALAQEVARKNVTVNAVAPGFIRTDMVEGLDEDTLKKTIPANRFGTPEEVAELVGFLVSPNAGYITGNVISINGGLYT